MKIFKYPFLALLFCLSSLLSFSQKMQNPVNFTTAVEKVNNTQVKIIFTANIESGWYMYGVNLPEEGPIPTSVELDPLPTFKLAGKLIEVTPSKQKRDEMFEITVTYFSENCKLAQIIEILDSKKFVLKGSVEYQVCNNVSCLPASYDFEIPIDPAAMQLSSSKNKEIKPSNTGTTTASATTSLVLSTSDSPVSGTVTASVENASTSEEEKTSTAEINTLEVSSNVEKSQEESLLIFFLLALLAGFGGVITPCVFPMIPMTIAFFINPRQTKISGIIKSIIFGLSIILIYTSIGVIASLTKSADPTGGIVTHWIPNGIFFLLFLIFAISFLGAFEITLPSKLSNSVDKQADKGGYLAAFFVALALVLVSFSCTGPFVGSLLVAAAGGSMIKPVVGMFGFGLAFAMPFFILSLSPALMKKLPKSGGWLNSVKVLFAVILLALCIKFLNVVTLSLCGEEWVSFEVAVSFWIALSLLFGVYLLGKINLSHDTGVKHVGAFRFLLAIVSFTFAIYLLGGLMKTCDLGAFSAVLPTQSETTSSITIENHSSPQNITPCGDIPKYGDLGFKAPKGIRSYFDIQQALACAKTQGKRVFIDFKGHFCGNCKKMENTVFKDQRIIDLLNNQYVTVCLYTDDKTKLPEDEWFQSTFDKKIKKTIGEKNADYLITKFGVNAIPYFAVIDSEGNSKIPATGYVSDADNFLEIIQAGLTAK